MVKKVGQGKTGFLWSEKSLPRQTYYKFKIKQGLCTNLEGWDGEGDGREVQKGGDIRIPMADSCWGLTENSKVP